MSFEKVLNYVEENKAQHLEETLKQNDIKIKRREKAPVDKAVDAIIHEFNVSHSLHSNPRARYHVLKQCVILDNASKIKWNELGYWMNANPNASGADIRLIRQMLDDGADVRGFEIEGGADGY